jgi:hypothetical protein
MMHQDSSGSYLDIGDVVLYGKFKNALGRITAFGVNEKGDPTIDVQPVSKDGSDRPGGPKTLTLLKVRKVEKKAMTSARQIVARFLDKVARGVSRGETWENGKVRIHRYNDSFHIWDLTNAGKRGKRVDMMTAQPAGYRADNAEWMEEQSKYIVLNARSYDSIKAYLAGLGPDTVNVSESQERGIDVLPGDVKEIKLRWKVGEELLDLKASPMEFLVSSSVPLGPSPVTGKSVGRQNTMYWHVKKIDAALFYGWLRDNETKVQTMTIQDIIRDVWHKLGVNFDSH